MGQEVILNGKPLDLDYYPSLQVGNKPNRRTPITINGKMVHGVNINGYDYPPAEPGCVLYLPGLPGQGATIWDRSGYGNNGTITGATWERLPSGLWVNSFDGTDDYIDCGTALPTGYTGLTLVTWIYRSSIDAGEHYIFNKWAPEIYFAVSGNVLTAYCTVTGVQKGPCTSTTTINDSKWHLAVYRWDGANMQIFVDGIADGSPVAAVGTFGVAATLIIGSNNTHNGAWLDAKLGLPRMFTCALSANEITSIYNQERSLFP